MSSGSYKQVYVRCPFYRSDDGAHKIICEGVVERGNLTILFTRKADYEKYISQLCSGDYSKCIINEMLMSKYKGDD